MKILFLAACVAAAIGGCGSRKLMVSLDGASGGPPDLSPPVTIPTADLPPTALSCPASPPTPAAACPLTGQVCPYAPPEDSDPSPGCHRVFRCDAGRWLQIVGCLQTIQGCPAQRPARGASCSSAVKGQNCYYRAAGQPCDEGSIAQCDGKVWRHVNGCPTRDEKPVQETCAIQPTLDPEPVLEQPGKQLDAPAIAVAGTQAMVAVVVSAGKDETHGTYLHRVDTSRPQDEKKLTWPGDAMLLGRDSISAPALGFARDRFILAWVANDGWPGTTSHQPGAFVRGVPLSGDPAPKEVLVEAAGSTISSLAVAGGGGWLAFRHPSSHDAAKSAVSRIALGTDLAPLPSSRAVIADEGEPPTWFQQPIPLAFARVVRRSSGYVVAAPVAAAGDAADDSGIRVCFHEEAAPAEPTCVRLAVGFPARMSIAALHDGSVAVAYAGVGWDKTPPATAPFKIVRVFADGTSSPVSNLVVASDPLASGPHLVPFDRGFAAAWTTVKNPGQKSGALHLRLFKAQSSSTTHSSFGELTRELPDLRSTDRLAIAYAHTDRSLHLAWSLNGGDGLSRVYRQRLICGASN